MHPLEQLAREWADKVESYRLTHYAFMDGIGAEISRIEESAPGYSKGAYEEAQKRALKARARRPKP